LILLDTHALIWLDEANPRLGSQALSAIDEAFAAGTLMISAISFWEVGTLVKKGRLRLEIELGAWRQDFFRQGLIELPVSGEIAIKAASLSSFHGDPADRLIAATALVNSLTLLTADERLLRTELALLKLDARH